MCYFLSTQVCSFWCTQTLLTVFPLLFFPWDEKTTNFLEAETILMQISLSSLSFSSLSIYSVHYLKLHTIPTKAVFFLRQGKGLFHNKILEASICFSGTVWHWWVGFAFLSLSNPSDSFPEKLTSPLPFCHFCCRLSQNALFPLCLSSTASCFFSSHLIGKTSFEF